MAIAKTLINAVRMYTDEPTNHYVYTTVPWVLENLQTSINEIQSEVTQIHSIAIIHN